MVSEYAGNTAIVTGGASGIGKALGAELFAQGAHVVLADIDGAAAESAAKMLADANGHATGSIVGRSLDVRDEAAVHALVDEIVARDGHLDLMFNNAGLGIGGQTHEFHKEHWNRIIDVNINGVVNGVLAAYPLMIEQGHGHIVNTASAAGLAPAVLTAAYTTTKHAVVGLSTALRPEAAAFGVRVSVLCPGVVETPILDKAQPSDLPPRGASPSRRASISRPWDCRRCPHLVLRSAHCGRSRATRQSSSFPGALAECGTSSGSPPPSSNASADGRRAAC